jgi:hypothetical protein
LGWDCCVNITQLFEKKLKFTTVELASNNVLRSFDAAARPVFLNSGGSGGTIDP